MSRFFTKKIIKEVAKKMLAGKRQSEIAGETNLTVSQIRGIVQNLRKKGLNIPKRGSRYDLAIKELEEEGATK